MSLRGLRNALSSVVPKWLQNRPGAKVGFKFLYAMVQPLDVLLEQLDEGLAAAYPGRGTDTALPLLGQARGIIQGEAETDGAFASRLIPWLDTWANAASDAVVAREIQAYLGNTPTVRIVSRAGSWTTLAPDGTIATVTAAWDWDSHSDPVRSDPANPWWSDLWIIIYPAEWAVTGSSLSALAPIWGTHNLGTGHAVGRAAVDAILSIVAHWKGCHTAVQAILWSYDASLFDPANPSAPGNPDGWWGRWGKDDGSGNRIPARGTSTRYWIPPNNPISG